MFRRRRRTEPVKFATYPEFVAAHTIRQLPRRTPVECRWCGRVIARTVGGGWAHTSTFNAECAQSWTRGPRRKAHPTQPHKADQ